MVLLSACNSRSKTLNTDDFSEKSSFLFRMNASFTDAEKFLSFPIWFNDSLVSKNKILKLTRSTYYIDIEDTMELSGLSNEIPREKKEYLFHPNGQVKQLKVSYFYDDEEIGHVVYLYTSMKDKFGFATVIKSAENQAETENDETSEDFPHYVHHLVKKTKKYLAFQDEESGNYLFYMLNKKYWGPLSIDSILGPMPKDIIVLGSPYVPAKQYSVENKVYENNVINYVYDKKTQIVKSINRQEYPFDLRRTLVYSKNGICEGYIDSTFSGDLFLTRTVAKMDLDKNNKPLRIVNRKENQHAKTGRIWVEIFAYE